MNASSIPLQEILRNLQHDYLLPALQRDYTWKPQQIEALFDSLMQDYPINTMMFWEIRNIGQQNLDFYKFLEPEYEKGKSINSLLTAAQKSNDYGNRPIKVVIDGQQRLTSLYIALCGSYDGKKLHLRLDQGAKSDARNGMKYDFKFLTEKELNKREKHGQRWMSVSEVVAVDFKRGACERHHEVSENDFAIDTIEKLENLYKRTDLNYYNIAGYDEIDRVLDIFVRTNSGGSPLTKGDLLLSSLTTEWAGDNGNNARDFVNDIVNRVADKGFTIKKDKDWVLKSFLLLCDSSLKMKVATFKEAGVSQKVYRQRNDIADSIVKAFSIVADFGLTDKGLTTQLAVMLIAYFIFKNKLQNTTFNDTTNKESFKAFRQFVFCAILKNVFASQSDETLNKMRTIIQNNGKSFPFESLAKEIDKLRITEADIDKLMTTRKNEAYALLNILYILGGKVIDRSRKYDVDHIHSRVQSKAQEIDESSFDAVPNLQLLNASVNRSKNATALSDWLNRKDNEDVKQWKENNFIPLDASPDINDSNAFWNSRKAIFKGLLQKFAGIETTTCEK